MSLLRLLAAGSSLSGIKTRRSPYKLVQQNLLPKFGGESTELASVSSTATMPARRRTGVAELRRVEARPTTPQPRAVPLSAGRESQIHAVMPTSGARDANLSSREYSRDEPSLAQVAALPKERMQMSAPEGDANKGPLKPKKRISIFQRWGQMKNPFRQKTPGRKSAPPAVQGELRLESVKVVRNDLNEADLEIVAGKEEGEKPVAAPESTKCATKCEGKEEVASASAAPASPTPNQQASRVVWQRIATRLFGTGRT